MFDSLLLLLNGFVDCLSLMNIFCAIVGSLLGSLIGVLPGLGISGTVAILLPLTYGMSPLSALIMISGIYFSFHQCSQTWRALAATWSSRGPHRLPLRS